MPVRDAFIWSNKKEASFLKSSVLGLQSGDVFVGENVGETRQRPQGAGQTPCEKECRNSAAAQAEALDGGVLI
jgi:hypothetical protein